MSCICEGGFHPNCPIHREVKLHLNREMLDVLIDVLTASKMRGTQREEGYVELLRTQTKKLKEKFQ